MLNFSASRKTNVNFSIGDSVIITKASNASLNLYMKTKQAGMIYIRCPCNAKTGTVLNISAKFVNGFLLKTNTGFCTVAHPNDLRKV